MLLHMDMGPNAIRPDTEKAPSERYEYIRVINILAPSFVNIDLYFFTNQPLSQSIQLQNRGLLVEHWQSRISRYSPTNNIHSNLLNLRFHFFVQYYPLNREIPNERTRIQSSKGVK